MLTTLPCFFLETYAVGLMGMGFAHPCKFGCYSHPNLFIYVCAIPRTAYLAVGIGAPPEAFRSVAEE